MKIGTFLLLFLAVGSFLLWKYSGHLKRLFAASATPSGTAKSVKDLIAKYALSILLVVVGLVVFFQGVYLSEWKTPSFSAVGSWSWGHWLQLLVLWGIGSALLALNKKVLGAAVPVLQSLFAGIVVMAFLVCPVIGWFEGPSTSRPQAAISAPQECSKDRHCILHEQDDGSTERVSVPKGKTLCLDRSAWDSIDKLGLRSTYQGGPEVAHTCTRDQVISGTCREPNLDSFRFVPKGEVRIPRYWFVPEFADC